MSTASRVIHVHVNALTEKEARGLEERLGKVLGAGARRGCRLEADAGPPRPGDLRIALRGRFR